VPATPCVDDGTGNGLANYPAPSAACSAPGKPVRSRFHERRHPTQGQLSHACGGWCGRLLCPPL